jgi:hypothetical protein
LCPAVPESRQAEPPPARWFPARWRPSAWTAAGLSRAPTRWRRRGSYELVVPVAVKPATVAAEGAARPRGTRTERPGSAGTTRRPARSSTWPPGSTAA